MAKIHLYTLSTPDNLEFEILFISVQVGYVRIGTSCVIPLLEGKGFKYEKLEDAHVYTIYF